MTLVETLFVGFLMMIVGIGMWGLMQSTYTAQFGIVNTNTALTKARVATDTLMDRLRGMQVNTTLPTPTCFYAASTTSIEYYDYYNQYNTTKPATLVRVRYWLSGNKLLQTVNALPVGGATVIDNVQSLSFNYGLKTGGTTAAPTAANLPNINAVSFSVSVNVDGSGEQMTGSIQIRSQR